MCGGFIWDFVDQSIHQKFNCTDRWLYGIDFDEKYSDKGFRKKGKSGNDGAFCANGILAADRSFHPAAYEVMHVYKPMRVIKAPNTGESDSYEIENLRMFGRLSDTFLLKWELLANGHKVKSGKVPDDILENAEPMGKVPFKLGDFYDIDARDEYILSFRWIYKEDVAWAQKGEDAGTDQFILQPYNAQLKAERNCSTEGLSEGKNWLDVTDESAMWNVVEGITLKMNLCRTATDNDIDIGNFNPFLERFTVNNKWMTADMKMSIRATNFEEGNICCRISFVHPLCKRLEMAISRISDEVCDVHLEMIPKKVEAIRLGIEMELPKEFDKVSWYGRGPIECYPDRKKCAPLGRYNSTVYDMTHKYMRPQENGGRCDVREVELLQDNGKKFRVISLQDNGILFSVMDYRRSSLKKAKHWDEVERGVCTTLDIDGVMRGVGGDLPGMNSLHEKYVLKKNRTYTADFRLCYEG